MSENKKGKNQSTKEILGRSFDLYKKFLDNPSKKNLNAFVEVAENYKEAFIEDTPDFLSTSSIDLHSFIQVKVDSHTSLIFNICTVSVGLPKVKLYLFCAKSQIQLSICNSDSCGSIHSG